MQLILASSSPRRKEILNNSGFVYIVDPALIDETMLANLSPLENVKMRTVPGGPSPEMVEIARADIKEFLDEEFEKKGI